MKIVTTKQNSSQWRTWRGLGLGASDAPAFMGASPWTSPFELWLQKTGLMDRATPNEYQLAAMRRGTELEPVARAMFELEKGAKFEAISAEHDDHSWLRASFDGHNAELNAILEIKCPNKVDHAKAVKGQVPSKYMAQVQQQLLISGAAVCYYYSWDGRSDKGAIVEVRPDADYQGLLLKTALDFWQRVCTKVPPDITSADVKKVVDSLTQGLEQVNRASAVLAIITKD